MKDTIAKEHIEAYKESTAGWGRSTKSAVERLMAGLSPSQSGNSHFSIFLIHLLTTDSPLHTINSTHNTHSLSFSLTVSLMCLVKGLQEATGNGVIMKLGNPLLLLISAFYCLTSFSHIFEAPQPHTHTHTHTHSLTHSFTYTLYLLLSFLD
jgi:hypothetical protein